MHELPSQWTGLCLLVFLLGVRHGFDADHLAAIDGLTRINQRRGRAFAPQCGMLFSLGHGVVVLSIALAVGIAQRSQTVPGWLELSGAWISIAFLALIGIVNLRAVLTAAPHSAVAPVGVKGRFLKRAMQAGHPLTVALVGMLYAISFDTVSQSVLFAMTAARFGGLAASLFIGTLFVLAMVVTDGANGLWISRLLVRSDRVGVIASRVMGSGIAIVSLLTAAYGATRLAAPALDDWSSAHEWTVGVAVTGVVLLCYLIGRRLAPSAALGVMALVLLGPLAGGTAVAAPPEPPSDARCLGCHDDPTLKNADGRSLAVAAAAFTGSAHHGLGCVDCHKDAASVRHPRQALGAVPVEVCAGCHQEDLERLKGSVHGWQSVSPATCAGCHGDPHAVLNHRNPNNSMSAVNQVRNCGQCHRSMMQGYLSSEHARALFVSGLVSAPACTDCHGSGHEIQPPTAAAAATSHARIPQTCGSCHAGILSRWRDSAHGALWTHGDKNGPVCTTCHQAHAVKPPQSAAMRQAFPGDCGDCHSRYYESFRDTLHAKATMLGETAAAMCSDCHTAHQNLPAADPRSSVNPARLATTCGRCHQGQVTASFLTFDPHADPGNPSRNPYLHWVWLLMTLLLLGVFGFFGLHDVLWLQRTVVGKLRGEYREVQPGSGRYVRRFTTTQIWVHVTVVVSFLVLAATGLPLKYASARWAPGLMALWGGPHSAGIFHRIAAVVTFGYFGFHVLSALYQMIVRHERGYLWGPRSMVPQLSDVRDFAANVGYFLYLRPRPQFDRWTYWEKFDYLAVFWGVAIIGLTGLMLWFPGVFTHFLPGWTLNAAYIAHSDEALLATGFIFLFHYFHTHLRPESFPMDTVIFTGRMSLERFAKERPLEYRRLVAANRLDSVLTSAPTRSELVRAYVFGFAAVAIGVALAVGIFVALLGSLSR